VIVLAWFGVIALMRALIPVVAILPILMYIGMLIGSQAFLETPRRHAPAIILAPLPNIAAWTKNRVVGAAEIWASAVGLDKLGDQGVLYQGIATLGGLVLAAIAAFMIEREFFKAASFAVAGAALTFFGLMHSEQIGIRQSPPLAVAYLCVGALLLGCTKLASAPVAQHASATEDNKVLDTAGQIV
jgi:AGZA family xanthine/uracil permease-like MFS transporter